MSDRQGILCFVVHIIAVVVAVSAVAAGSLMTGGIAVAVYGVSGALVIRYIAS